MFDENKVINAIRMQGPVIPVRIAKVLGTDTIMASAVLSNLISSGKVKISNLKVGGSPVYYLPGQEAKLQDFEKYLNEKDIRTVDLLRSKKLIRDAEAEPLTRVSLRQVKDFAVPLQVNVNGNKELFWKWYLTTNPEAESLLKQRFIPEKKEEARQEAQTQATSSQKPETRNQNPVASSQNPEPRNQKPESSYQQPETRNQNPVASSQNPANRNQNPVTSKQNPEPRNLEEIKKQEPKKEEQKTITGEKQKIPAKKEQRNNEDYFKKVMSHFSRKDISVVREIEKKKNEADMIIRIPSQIGELEYFCRIKDKKRITDSDLDAVFAHGQIMKMPALLVISGELNKKAQEKLKEFKNIFIKQV